MDKANEKLSGKDWFLASIAGIASYLDAALLVSAGIALAIWSDHFGVNAWWTGVISTTLTLSVAIGALLGGRLSDKFGRVRVFNIDILLVAVGSLIIGFAGSLEMLLVGLVIAGLASGADLPTSLAVITERVAPERHGKVITVTGMFWILGILLSQALGFATATMGMTGTRLLFIWIAAVALINWGMRVFSRRFRQVEQELYEENAHKNASTQPETKLSIRTIFASKRYLLPLLSVTGFYLFWNIPANTWGSFVNYFLVTINGRSQSYSTALGFFANAAAIAVLFFIYMRFADTKHRYTMMNIGLLLCTLSFVVSGIFGATSWIVFSIAYFVYSACNNLHGESIFKIWTQAFYSPDMRASATGVSIAIVRILTAVCSVFTPVIMNYSPNLLMWLLVASLLICWIFAGVTIRMVRKYNIADPGIKGPEPSASARAAAQK
ncbi:MFS transporter [Saccharibacillus sp. CPCC 101409]|uniref:MFS transporter n=1 Tax=Saccharibacillus sp. CPCC 101409 TaxID=3058041 RepID=UPI002673E088|nr:MFS transporter [Saccharibacillus sp. CPCC 101409]MDO3409749.1 MFS transporter [Saccharibacillus sp. CPCC 101409]